MLVTGEPGNFKITGADDLARARALLEPAVAMGVGYDVHAFAPGRKLVLGGVALMAETSGGEYDGAFADPEGRAREGVLHLMISAQTFLG